MSWRSALFVSQREAFSNGEPYVQKVMRHMEKPMLKSFVKDQSKNIVEPRGCSQEPSSPIACTKCNMNAVLMAYKFPARVVASLGSNPNGIILLLRRGRLMVPKVVHGGPKCQSRITLLKIKPMIAQRVALLLKSPTSGSFKMSNPG